MRVEGQIQENQLEARNPYELRVDRARDVPESDVRQALATGEMDWSAADILQIETIVSLFR